MKLGLLGDIHGNSLALRAVLDSAAARSIEALCITGDFIGYYFHPDEVLGLLREWKTFCVQGNHERMLADVIADPQRLPECEFRYGSGLRHALDLLNREQLAKLRALPEELVVEMGGRKIMIAHGTPWDGDYYLYPDSPDELWQRVGQADADLVVLGHTHYRTQRQVGQTLIVNPGSVGQPRDGIPGAAWAVYDTDTNTCEQLVERYDVEAVIAEAMLHSPDNSYLRDILRRE